MVCTIEKKILFYSWNKFHIQIKVIEFSVYCIFFGFWTHFFQILDTACNATLLRPPMEIKRLFFHFKISYNKTDASVFNLTDI